MRVLHLVGSPTSAFMADLSLVYARDCLQTLRRDPRWEHDVAFVDPGGAWCFPVALDDDALAAAPRMPVVDALARIDGLGVDVMVPQLFCLAGMTAYRALFDVLGIPYVGNRPEAMALTADKARAKAVVAAAGVAAPPDRVVRRGDPLPAFEAPVVVKPVDADNSHGVTLVRTRDALGGAVADALAHGSAALVERYVPLGREVRCGVLERDGSLVVLPLEEYAVEGVRTAADKLARSDDGALGLVAKTADRAWVVAPEDAVNETVGAAARACHVALGCRHHGLFDFRVDPDGEPWFLEAGLYCSFARGSVVATMARAAGIQTDELFAAAVAAATATEEVPTWST